MKGRSRALVSIRVEVAEFGLGPTALCLFSSRSFSASPQPVSQHTVTQFQSCNVYNVFKAHESNIPILCIPELDCPLASVAPKPATYDAHTHPARE